MTSIPQTAFSNPWTIGRAIKRGFAVLLAGAWMLGAAHAQQAAVLQQGNAVVTGFSGTAPSATPPASGNPIDGQFIDLSGASARILNMQTGGQPPQGQLIASPTVLPVKAGDVGQVFGIALDDGKGPDGTASGVPDIYLTATSAFGLQIVAPDAKGVMQRLHVGQPGAQWMAGQWGDSTKNATPGSIWKVSGTTGAVSLFANVILNGQPNSGPGLGNIAFDAKTRQVFVSDLETGMIHRFDMQGQDLGYYDHGTQGRVAQGLAPSPYDPANRLDLTSPSFSVDDATTWHYAPKGRLVWGLKVSAGRLYYATADGPQVWSISIGEDGSFGSDPRMEIDVTGTPNNNVISDVTFDGPDMIYLAQRGTAHGDYSYKTFADPAKSVAIRYARDPQTGKWAQQYEEYAVGFPPENRNTNGGVAIDTCNTFVWTTGELLRVGSGLGDPEVVHGLQGMDKSLVRPANVPPKQSYFADYDGQFNDPDVHGHMGDVEVWHPCQSVGLTQPPIVPPPPFNLTLTKDVAPYICPPGVDCKQPAPGSIPTDCVPGGQGWLCTYKIIVKNTGSTPYSGPLTVDDWLPAAPAGAIMTFSPMPPWFCTMTGPDAYQCVDPSVSLNPSDSVELDVVVDLPKSYQYCYLDNNATIDWPAGSGDADPSDDGAYASAHIPGSYCPPPQGNKTNLKLQKFAKPYCKPWQGAYLCEYFVWVSNTGPGVYSDKLVVADTLPAGDSMVAVSPPWSCVGGPPTYQCTHPSVTLNPGQGRGFFMWVKAPFNYDKPDCDLTNHAHITFAPGGSNENINPGDDDASATAHIPSDKCYGQKTNLKIDKYPYKCVRYDENGEGWDCAYVIVVTNTGPGIFSGPITVKDTFGGQAVPQNWPAPWSCSGAAGSLYCTHPSVTLNPSGIVWALVSGKVDETQVKQGQCTVTNNASINAPIGGSPQNTNPGDDTATATDSIPDPSCKQPVPLPTPDGHVSILKTCKASAVGAGIVCQITVTNDGGQPITTTITFTDKGQWSGNGSPMHVLAAKPDSAALSCGGLPDNLSCSIAGKDLPPGTAHSVEIDLANGGDQTHYKNCAILTAVNGSDLEGPGHKSCVEGGGDISVLKTGPATCFWGQACTFEVAIVNNSGSPYSGPLLVGDAMFLNNTAQFDLPITVSPPFGCPTEPTSLQFNCVAQVSLGGHEQQNHTVTVQMPAGDQSKGANGLNCAFATDGSKGVPPPKVTDLSAAGFTPHAGNGPGYSCVPFTVPVIETLQKFTCPGDEVRIGTQCQCPPGTTPFGHFRCQPSTAPPVCTDRDRRLTNGDCCPFGTVAIGNACRGKETPVCQPPFVGIYPDCHCPEGSVFNRDRKTCGQPNQHCLPPMVGEYPDCHCPSGSRFNVDRQICVPVTNTCPPPRSMVDNECVCPGRLPYWNGTTCTRPPVTCTGGQVSNNDGGCVCPKDRPLFLNGECSRPPVTCTGGQVSNNDGGCVCPKDRPLFLHGECTRPTVTCTGGQVSNNDGGCVCPTDKPFFANGVCGRPRNIFCRFPLVQQPDGSCGCPNKGDVLTNGKCVAPDTGKKGGQTDCKGIMLNGVCVTKLVPQPTETACPRPAHGFLPNCTCPGRLTWNGSTCVVPSGTTGKTGNTGGTTTTTQNCPKGQHWNGHGCATDTNNGGVLKKLNIPGLGNIFKSN